MSLLRNSQNLFLLNYLTQASLQKLVLSKIDNLVGWVEWYFYHPPSCCFSLNNLEMVKAVTLAFCSI